MKTERTENMTTNAITVYIRLPIGSVIRTHVDNTNPPKIKIFVIVGYYEEDAITIFFNTEINNIINYSEELRSLHIPFSSSGRSFLTRDCFCDCSHLSLRNKDELHIAVNNQPEINIGNLSVEDLDIVMTTLKNSTKIKGAYKKRYGFYDYGIST